MDLKPRYLDEDLVLTLEGKINHQGSDEFRDALLPLVEATETGYSRIVLDMSAVEYMSSVGLRVLMVAAKSAKQNQKKIVVAGLNTTMREIFHISRFNLLYDVFNSVEDALATH